MHVQHVNSDMRTDSKHCNHVKSDVFLGFDRDVLYKCYTVVMSVRYIGKRGTIYNRPVLLILRRDHLQGVKQV